MNLKEILIKSRPDSTATTIKSYIRLLHRLKLGDDLTQLSDFDKVLDKIKEFDVGYLTERNYLNAVIVLMQGLGVDSTVIEPYQVHRDGLNQRYTDEQSTRTLSAKQEENWLTMEQLNALLAHMKNEVKSYPVGPLDNNSLRNLQNYFMLSFWIVYPLRNDLSDTVVMTKRVFNALDQDQKINKNYLVTDTKKPFLSLGRYKTVKTYGIKKIMITDPGVKKAMNRWLRANPLKFALIRIPKSGTDYRPMSSIGITQTFNRIFMHFYKKKFSTTMFRHVVLTEKFGDNLDELEKFRSIMGHSSQTAQTIYVKRRPGEVIMKSIPETSNLGP